MNDIATIRQNVYSALISAVQIPHPGLSFCFHANRIELGPVPSGEGDVLEQYIASAINRLSAIREHNDVKLFDVYYSYIVERGLTLIVYTINSELRN